MLEDNRTYFESACRRLGEASASTGTIRDLVAFAQRSGCGYYSSPDIERFLYALAQDGHLIRPCEKRSSVEPGTCLMVLSEVYATGGHTRVVERWIELDRTRRYSVVLTRHPVDRPLPVRLVHAVERSGGTIVSLDVGKDEFVRAGELRDFASRFDKVVLHIHTDDVIPLLAFGTETFTRPVGLYNHADHLFWLGVGIADCVAELRKSKIEMSRRIRGVDRSHYVGIPVDVKKQIFPDRAEAKRKLGILPDTPVIATCGSAAKYDRVLGMDFLAVAKRILVENPTAVLIGIGMTFRDLPTWGRASRELGGRLRAVGLVPFEHLYDYYDVADLYLDSYPFGGGTAMPDALCRGCPVLSLPEPCGKMDWVYDCGGYCRSEAELIGRAGTILRGDEDGAALSLREYEVFSRMNDVDSFRQRLDSFFDSLQPPHRLHDFRPGFDGFTDLDRFHAAKNNRREYICGTESSPAACYYQYSSFGRDKMLRLGSVSLCLKRRRLGI